MPDVILQTKLHVPTLRPALVSRPQLVEKLNSGLAGKLTLLSAAAGFGKTTITWPISRRTRLPIWVSFTAN